jgi:cellulose synthase (UDP-forming)
LVDVLTIKRMLMLNRAERKAAKEDQRRAAEAAKAAARAAEEAAKDQARAAAKEEKRKKRAGLAAAAAMLLALPLAGSLLAPQEARAAPAAAAAAPAPTGGGVVRERLTFKDLRIKNAVRLQGTRGEISIPFGVRKNQVVTDAAITLQLAWSPAMLGDLSQLVVLVNGEVVQTLALRPQDSGGQVLTLPINPALFLPGDNQLNLRLIGHYARVRGWTLPPRPCPTCPIFRACLARSSIARSTPRSRCRSCLPASPTRASWKRPGPWLAGWAAWPAIVAFRSSRFMARCRWAM